MVLIGTAVMAQESLLTSLTSQLGIMMCHVMCLNRWLLVIVISDGA